jgi:M6 family metalloprotease-like protein
MGHRPHPSYLDQTKYYAKHQHSEGRRGLYRTANGTMHNLVLLLRFSDHTARTLPSRAEISRLYNYAATDSFVDGRVDDIVPTGSVRQLYEFNSHHAFTVETTVVDWITLSRPESYYGNGNSGFTKFKEAIIEALTLLDNGGGGSMGGPPFDFGYFDLDENGALDGFGVLHSGYGAEYGGDDCHGTSDVHRIWSHKGGIDWTSSPEVGGDIVSVNRFYVSSALRGKCHSNIVRMGVIVHELGHYLGLPDLYDETFDGSGLGAYDFMSQSWGLDGSGMYPPNLSAWSKVHLGWANVEVIAYDGTYELESSATSNTVYKIVAGYPEGEFLLIENRQPTRYDMTMEGGGLAIYHIDDMADAQNNRGYPSPQSGWPENGRHYQVALLAADGEYDLEMGTNQGDSGDLWHSGSELKELSSGSASYPNTDSYQAGSIASTGIRLYDFSDSGNLMTFRVAGLGINAAGVGSPDGIAVSLESMMTPKQSPKPSTTKPVTKVPLSPPPTPKPITSTPTEVTAAPTSLSPTQKPVSRPTFKPTPFNSQLQSASICTNRCLEEIASSQCPPRPYELPDCLEVNVGELCDANGECGSNQMLNNCYPFDVYKRIDCSETNTSGATIDFSPNNCPYYPGWANSKPHCLNDCQQPEFMRSNVMFEFWSPVECCHIHYEGKSSCVADSQSSHSTIKLVNNAPTATDGEEEDSTPLRDYSSTHIKSSTSDSFIQIGSSSESSTTQVDITPTDDTTIHSEQSVTFSGGDEWLLVGPQISSSQLKWRDEILLKFDLTPFALTGRKSYRAVLRLFAVTSSPSGGVVHLTSSNVWEETKVDWSSAPMSEVTLGNIGPTRPNSWVEVDLTLPVLDDGFVTLRITPESSNHSWVAKYSSKDNRMGHPAPELRVFSI